LASAIEVDEDYRRYRQTRDEFNKISLA